MQKAVSITAQLAGSTMSIPDTSIPLLKIGITIVPYEDTVEGLPKRYLLTVGDAYFLISFKARALVLALLHRPETRRHLEIAFAAEAGDYMPADRLIALAQQTLPSALFRGTALPIAAKPFLISWILLRPQPAARLAAHLGWLFKSQVVIVLVAIFVVMHAAVLQNAIHLVHDAWTIQETLALSILFLFSGLVHELGHIAACHHFRCPHGGIGFGLYFIFPVWYADVTHAWQLQARRRAVIDLGGVYFQSILLIAVDAVALASGNPLALKLVWLVTFAMLFTLNPVFKFDGYWLLSDLSGLHNLHQQVRQSVTVLIARAMGKQGMPRPPLQVAILYVYLLLSAGYFFYVGLFLGRELHSFGATLSVAPPAHWQSLMLVDHVRCPDVALALGHCLGMLIWPLMIVFASIFFLNRLRQAVNVIATGIRAARELPPCRTHM